MNLRSWLFYVHFFLCQFALAQSKPLIQLFSIPNFTVELSLGSTMSLTAGSDTTSSSHNENLIYEVKAATEAYLVGYFESILEESGSGSKYALSEIQLTVSDSNTDMQIDEFIVNVSGEALFYDYLLAKLDYTLDQAMVEGWVRDAFSHSTGGSQNFLNLIQDFLPHARSVAVTLDMDIDVPEAEAEPEAEPMPLTDNGSGGPYFYSPNSDEESDVVVTNHNTNTITVEDDQDPPKDVGFPILFAFAVVGFAAGMFVYYVKGNRRTSGDGHLLLSRSEEHSDYSAEDVNRLSGELQFDEGLYETYDEEDGLQFIPVPAKFDVHPMDKKTKAVAKDVMPKRYVQPASPFEILYGAAFSHRDQAKVARAHGMKRQPRTIKVSGQKIRRKEPLKPMNTISESNDEDEGVKEKSQATQEPVSESFFPQIMSSISSFMEKRAQTSTTSTTVVDCNNNNSEQEPKKEDFVVYRDFPRHDGTPCVMFSPLDEIEWDSNETQSLTPTGSNGTFSLSDGHGPLSPYKSPKQHEQIDDFVDKLENLMAARSRQYEERKRMDMEIAERKRVRMAERNKAKEDEACGTVLDTDEGHPNDDNRQIKMGRNEEAKKLLSDHASDEHVEKCQEDDSVQHVSQKSLVADGVFEGISHPVKNSDTTISNELIPFEDMCPDDNGRDQLATTNETIESIGRTKTEMHEETEKHDCRVANFTEIEHESEEDNNNQAIAEILSLPQPASHAPGTEECAEKYNPKEDITVECISKSQDDNIVSSSHSTSLNSQEPSRQQFLAEDRKQCDFSDDSGEGVNDEEGIDGQDKKSNIDTNDPIHFENRNDKEEEIKVVESLHAMGNEKESDNQEK